MALIYHKVSNHIPNDLVFSILSKLPLKSMKRFKCVHKSWALSIETPDFKSEFLKNFISKYDSSYDDECLLLKQTIPGNDDYRCAVYILSGERFETKVKLELPLPFQYDDTCIDISGSSINGTICLFQGIDHKTFVLWNPTTREFKVIPPSNVGSLYYIKGLTTIQGFGYDSVKDDYKVIQHVKLLPFNSRVVMPKIYKNLWEIYSLKSKSWRKLDVDMPCRDTNIDDVYMNGMCHWWGIRNNGEYLVSFDLSDEVFLTTQVPLDMYVFSKYVERHLTVLNMFISLLTYHEYRACFEIFVLGELGLMESWTKLFVVRPFHGVEHPIGVGKKGHIFFQKENDELAYFDLCTGILEDIGIQGELFNCQIVIYKENIIRLP
ncbi:putative F-box domain, galactose oxidase/kelch, beta-propeller, F-box associated interaction [Medicago truncatula]|uniref:F-box protein interaction domain protein n=1 Tax=Medicago truncatula TaxID=3880 RepID=A0A072TQB3_MEDTR|nr:putative F-box protein At3g16210 [Medicago truncatula]KEH19602.1 F-box protein interaction domain protein [Medicago truncatula]RHN40972.1 putative F-box domain, galactose oxidase/kelch, beta-propeller, F-box associated interaction [Medicago truncatula]